MAGLNVGFEGAKKLFFDRAAVINAITKAERKVFSKFGAFVMTAARQSIKAQRRKSLSEMSDEERKDFKRRQAIARFYGRPTPKRPFVSSRPGEPPRNITGVLKKMIFFGLDFSSRSVIIGPALSNSPTGAPEVLEYGGTTTMTAGPNRGEQITIEPRPYMQPAFEKIMPQLNDMWRDAIKK